MRLARLLAMLGALVHAGRSLSSAHAIFGPLIHVSFQDVFVYVINNNNLLKCFNFVFVCFLLDVLESAGRFVSVHNLLLKFIELSEESR